VNRGTKVNKFLGKIDFFIVIIEKEGEVFIMV